MKKLTYALLASVALAATSFAGQEIRTGKETKTVLPPSTCFNDRELQVDVFGAYVDGNSPTHAGPNKDHAWGGGIGVNYFFTRNLGVGADAYWVNGRINNAQPGSYDRHQDNTQFQNYDGSLIFRLPLDRMCLAPYAFVGGGIDCEYKNWAVGFAGVGVEYRIVPAKVGIFTDARWNYYGDRFEHGDQNNFTMRAGLRVIF